MKKTYCNKCGKEFGEATQDYNDDFSIHTRIGYGSKYDMCGLALDLCSSCMDELIESCAITPIVDYEERWRAQDEIRDAEYAEVGAYA